MKRWYIKKQWQKFERFERYAFAKATAVVSVSKEDARLIRDGFGGQAVDVVDNGIDRLYFESVHAGAVQSDLIPGCPRLAAKPGCSEVTPGPDLPGGAGRVAVGAVMPGRPAATRGAGSASRGYPASSCTPMFRTFGRIWLAARDGRPLADWGRLALKVPRGTGHRPARYLHGSAPRGLNWSQGRITSRLTSPKQSVVNSSLASAIRHGPWRWPSTVALSCSTATIGTS